MTNSLFSLKRNSYFICRCWHVIQAQKATEMAPKHLVDILSLSDISEEQRRLVKERCDGDNIVLYELPGNNVCLPTFSADEPDEFPFTHIMNGKVSFCYYLSIVLAC